MVLEKLGDSLRAALRKIAGASYVDESLIKEIVRDIQRALIQADVNVQLSLSITRELHRRALEETPPPGMSPREHVVRIIYEELVKILGASRDVPLQKQRILLVGLYGQGKTTTAATDGHVDFTLTDSNGASSSLNAAASTCDDAGDNLDEFGQCTIVFVSYSAGQVTGHASITLAD